MPIETLYFLIIAIQKTATHEFVYYSHLYVASITPINTLITFRGVPHNVTRRIFPPIFPAGHETRLFLGLAEALKPCNEK